MKETFSFRTSDDHDGRDELGKVGVVGLVAPDGLLLRGGELPRVGGEGGGVLGRGEGEGREEEEGAVLIFFFEVGERKRGVGVERARKKKKRRKKTTTSKKIQLTVEEPLSLRVCLLNSQLFKCHAAGYRPVCSRAEERE